MEETFSPGYQKRFVLLSLRDLITKKGDKNPPKFEADFVFSSYLSGNIGNYIKFGAGVKTRGSRGQFVSKA